MRKLTFLFLSVLLSTLFFYSCDDNNVVEYKTTEVTIKLVYPKDVEPSEKVSVVLKNTSSNQSYNLETDMKGSVKFSVPEGLYEASATESRLVGLKSVIYNGANRKVVVGNQPITAEVEMVASNGGSLIIKELYIGGCPKDDGSNKAFADDQSIVLYNNSNMNIDLKNLALAVAEPYNAEGGNNKNYVDGALSYEKEGWIPATGGGIFYFPNSVIVEPGKQVVIAHGSAIDNTKTYSKSVNYANKDYFCCYDISSQFKHKKYVAPSELIPTSHYLKAYNYGLGTAWVLSQVSPAFFIFSNDGKELKSFIDDANSTINNKLVSKKVPVEWVVDAIEIYKNGGTGHQKRLSTAVDAGYVYTTGGLGHTLYRNVDKEKTEAIAENKGKIVYGYSKGVGTSTDPSGIDAEASIKNGARIIYKDTNNSTNDFHERMESSLR